MKRERGMEKEIVGERVRNKERASERDREGEEKRKCVCVCVCFCVVCICLLGREGAVSLAGSSKLNVRRKLPKEDYSQQ